MYCYINLSLSICAIKLSSASSSSSWMNSKQIKKEESEMEFNFENPFQEQELKPIEWLFETETQFMAAQGFFQNDEARRLRKIAVKKIRQLSQNGGFRHDPFVSFLAVNYYDRCISSYPLPGDEYSYGLFIISCVVIAWKMRKSGFYLPVFLETNRLYNVDYRQIERMEHRILYALKWRMRSVTALCFLDFFISFYNFTDIQEIATFKRLTLECKLLHMHYVQPTSMALLARNSHRMALVASQRSATNLSHLAFDTVHNNPSDLSSWLESMITELNPLPEFPSAIASETPNPKKVNFVLTPSPSDARTIGSPGPSSARGKSGFKNLLPKLSFKARRSQSDAERATAHPVVEASSPLPLPQEKPSISTSCSLAAVHVVMMMMMALSEELWQSDTNTTERIYSPDLGDARFTEFKPSTIAATALIAERPNIAPPPAFFCEPLLRCQYLNMDELENCHNLLMAQVRSNDLRTYLIPPSPSMDAIAEVEDDDQKRQRSRKRMRERGLV
ncbi:unnamed protein product [Camellia sinensis]